MATPTLHVQPGSPLNFQWAEFISKTGMSPSGAQLQWGDADATITLDLVFDDIANQALLQGVLQQIIGYALYVPATNANLNVGDITNATNAVPIVLTVPSWALVGGVSQQPYVGQVIKVAGVNGNTAANGIWTVQASTSSTVTLANSNGNGAFTASVGSTIRAGTGSINRVLPLKHPIWGQLTAQAISKVQFYGPDGKSVLPSPGFGPSSEWRNCRVEIHFKTHDYTILSDTDLQNREVGEFNRFVSGPYVDYNFIGLQRQPGVNTGFKWAGDAPFGLAGNYITQGVTQFLPTYDIIYTWRNVPEFAILDVNGILANINICYMKTNARTFLGNAPYTLLLQKPKARPVPAPFPLYANLDLPQRLWDVEVRMSYNPNGWLKVPTPKGGFATIITDDGFGLYYTVDYNTYLFQPL